MPISSTISSNFLFVRTPSSSISGGAWAASNTENNENLGLDDSTEVTSSTEASWVFSELISLFHWTTRLCEKKPGTICPHVRETVLVCDQVYGLSSRGKYKL